MENNVNSLRLVCLLLFIIFSIIFKLCNDILVYELKYNIIGKYLYI